MLEWSMTTQTQQGPKSLRRRSVRHLLQTVVEDAGSSAREDDDDAKAVDEGSEAKEQVREGNGAAAPP